MTIIVNTSRYKEIHKSEPFGSNTFIFTDDEDFYARVSGDYHKIRAEIVEMYSKEYNTRNGVLHLLSNASKSSSVHKEELEKIQKLLL